MGGQNTGFDLLKEEYIALRAEILQSISYQHQILLAGYAANGALFGYVAGMDKPLWEALTAIPFLFLAMSSLWIVECNRMMRAGYYIGAVLWPEIKQQASYNGSAHWEAWIRKMENQDNIAWQFGQTQHNQQRFVVQAVPMIISSVSLAVAIISAWENSVSMGLFVSLGGVVIFILWYRVFRNICTVTDLSARTLPEVQKGNTGA